MRILITGASRGIGREVSAELAQPGRKLAICGSSPSSELDAAVEEARHKGAEAIALTGDLDLSSTPQSLVSAATEAFGGLDGVVSNAGIAKPSALSELSEEDWDRVVNVNLKSAWLLAKASYGTLKANRGSFVAVASMSGLEPYPGMAAYSPSKAGLIMLVRTLGLEWAAEGVRVNAVSPGLFHSAMTEAVYRDPQKKAAREALIPMHRIGNPGRDLSGIIDFLLSDKAGYITGQNVLVDGGLIGSIHAQIAGRPQSVSSAG